MVKEYEVKNMVSYIYRNYFRFATIALVLIFIFGCKPEDKSATYICPPCDLSCDLVTFDKPGVCPHCKMQLILGSINRDLSEEEQVASLFSKYDYDSVPGAAIGVIKDGELMYAKGFGSANLDYEIPITTDSKFYIGSMAKQFVGAALLKLETEGKIDFEQPVQRYLPDFPIYADTIKIKHIIHHTSGIRCTSSMQLIAGIKSNFEDYFTSEQQYEMIKSQRELNFKPGTEFRYSSGGYIILAKVVESISGMSFRNYVDQNIFQPLGMKNTFVIDDHNEVVKNRVTSYFPIHNGKFERRSLIFDGKGDGSMLTTINDLVKWDRAFYDDILLGIPNFSEKMYEGGYLSSGHQLSYGMALETYTYNGLEYVGHNGGMLGFRADMIRFPKQKFSVIVLANNAEIHSTGMALKIADIYLKDLYTEDKKDLQSVKKRTTLTAKKLRSLIGKYFSDDTNSWRRISYNQDTLFYDSGNLDFKIPLEAIGTNKFYNNQLNRILTFQEGNLIIDYRTHTHILKKFDDTPPENLSELLPFTGTYYSEELNTYYKVYESESRLKIQVNNNEPIAIFPDPDDPRINWNSKNKVWIGYAMISFEKNGFTIGDNRIKSIFFKRLSK